MALLPVTAVTAHPAVRVPRARAWTPPEGEDAWTMPFGWQDVPHAPRPLDAIAAYREPFGPRPLLLDAYA